jgi:uncharacterized protein (DUF427 family)
MGLSWQQGPLGGGAVGGVQSPAPQPPTPRLAQPRPRPLGGRVGGEWIADSEDVLLLHEPGRYPVAYFPRRDVRLDALSAATRTTRHRDLGSTAWFTVSSGSRSVERAAWEHVDLPGYAGELAGRVAFAWRAMDAFYEEDERILGHAADAYHRIDIRTTSRRLVVRAGDRVVAESTRPLVLYESGFAPRWYVPREDVAADALVPVDGQTFCPYKGLADYYDIGTAGRAAWSYRDAYTEVGRVSDLVSFDPDKVEVYLDGTRLHLERGQQVRPHGIDRGLDTDELISID